MRDKIVIDIVSNGAFQKIKIILRVELYCIYINILYNILKIINRLYRNYKIII